MSVGGNMPQYRVEVRFDMGMSNGTDTHIFEAKDDTEALEYCKTMKGGDLSPIMRDVFFMISTLSRVVGT